MTLGRLAASFTQDGEEGQKAKENKDLKHFSLDRIAQFEKDKAAQLTQTGQNKAKPNPKATSSRLQALTEG